MSNQLSDSLREHEYRTQLVSTLKKIVDAIETQNMIYQAHIELQKKSLAVLMLNSKVNAKTAVVVNALSITEYKEFIELLNSI